MSAPMLDGKVVGLVIMEFRKRKGLSQEVMSGLAGIDRTHLSAIEHGNRKPTLETFYRLCYALDTPMETIIGEIEKRL